MNDMSDNSIQLSSEESDASAPSVESNASSDSIIIDNEWRFIAIGVESADPVCVKLNELIRRGKMSKERIFYKYLQDVVEFYYDPRHEYSEDVVEFFNTLSYLGGRRTTNMIRDQCLQDKEGVLFMVQIHVE